MQLDIPAFDWPAVSWPAIQYPLDEFAAENAEAEARAIANVEETIKAQAKKGKKVAALIVEPVQSEGGDNHASPNFFKALRTVTRVSCLWFVRLGAVGRNRLRNGNNPLTPRSLLAAQEHGGQSASLMQHPRTCALCLA